MAKLQEIQQKLWVDELYSIFVEKLQNNLVSDSVDDLL